MVASASESQETVARVLRYWGKTAGDDSESYHPAFYHCLDVAAAGRRLLEVRQHQLESLASLCGAGSPVGLVSWLTFLLSLHDLGKIGDAFQGLRPDLMRRLQGRETELVYKPPWRHDATTSALLRHVLLGEPGLAEVWFGPTMGCDRRLAFAWFAPICGHHGLPVPADPKLKRRTELCRQVPPDVQRDAVLWCRANAGFLLRNALQFESSDPDEQEKLVRAISWLLAGWAVCSDWIGSSSEWFPFEVEPMSGEDYWRELALPRAARAVSEAGLEPSGPATTVDYRRLWGDAFAPTELQHLAAQLEIGPEPQLVVIEEATGGGKTEAALLLAGRLMSEGLAEGIYFGLPTMATANAMHGRVGAVFRRLFDERADPSLLLAHSKQRLYHALERLPARSSNAGSEEDSGREATRWLSDSRKKALLAAVGVGTIDQALIGVLPIRHQSMRVWGLLGKVLIVDEVHAADAYLNELLCRLLELHSAYGGSAILLSATLPLAQRRQLAAAFLAPHGVELPELVDPVYPCVTQVTSSGVASIHRFESRPEGRRRVDVELLSSEEEAEAVLEAALSAGQCACWIRNTVADATETYERWLLRLPAERVRLFHSRFTVDDRAAIEADTIVRFGPRSGPDERRGNLLVATQVVEQSLDLDFDVLVTDLAPIDLVIQRLGRYRRHSRDSTGRRVVGPDQRGSPTLFVVSPDPVDDPDPGWYSALFRRAAFVYPHHGQLWLTARWLQRQGALRVPDDLRDAIEWVYGTVAEPIPPELHETSTRAEGREKAHSALALQNAIALFSGYDGGNPAWAADVETPTRLGEPTTRVRLCRRVGEEVEPWHATGDYAWERSEVSVARWRIASEDPAIEALLRAAKSTMRDEGRYCVSVPLVRGAEGWAGSALDDQGQVVNVAYGPWGLRMGVREH